MEIIRPGHVPEPPADGETREASSVFDAIRNGNSRFQAAPAALDRELPDWAQGLAAASRDDGPGDGVET